jgi:L-aspartate semialdehyde sulfurtransferase ferredoxin
MIAIHVDERACVSCEECVDACPTQVFAYDAQAGLPRVVRPAECFGCLACSQECPAGAITHEGVEEALNFYHDPYALEVGRKLTGSPADGARPLDESQLPHALDDVGVRLLAVAAALNATLSSGLPAVGTFAGRTLAGQLPRYRVATTLQEALELTREQFAPAWDIEAHVNADALDITVKECFVRELCGKEKLSLGGDLCTLFYHYLAGYLARTGKFRPRLLSAERAAESCTYRTRMYPPV